MGRFNTLTELPRLSVPSGAITATYTAYFTAPTGQAFMVKYLVINQDADADFATGDEDITFTIDYTLDGTAWVVVATAADLGGTIDGNQFLQYEPVTFPVVAAAQAVTAQADNELNVRVPPEATVRVVATIVGTTPVFTGQIPSVVGKFI